MDTENSKSYNSETLTNDTNKLNAQNIILNKKNYEGACKYKIKEIDET
jgi:hypothetical protein